MSSNISNLLSVCSGLRFRFAIFAAFCCAVSPLAVAAQTSTLDKLKNQAEKLAEPITGARDDRLEEVATFDHQVTGVTVSEDGRIFVNFPRWTEDVPVSVAEVMKDGTIKPYPDNTWNDWRNSRMAVLSPKDHFVTVQSVVADGRGSLWVLDPAAPNSEKVVKDGPKLVQIDLKTNTVKKTYPFPSDIAGPASYLNDVRFAPDGKFAYITDSGMPGGIVVANLETEKSWRALSDDPSTQMEKDVVVMTDGKPLKRADGRQPMFNADGIALSTDGKQLYWQALTGKTLYRMATDILQKASDDPSAICANAVKKLKPDGTIETVLTDARLRWPDTFAQGPDGAIYVTASHIQDSPWFNKNRTDDGFTLFRFKPGNP